jgi:hypothetical protein
LLNKVKSRCLFYYELEEKFLSRASIKPTATSDEIFNSDSEGSVFHHSDSKYSENETVDRNTSSTTNRRQKRTTQQTPTSSRKTKKNRNEQHSGNELESSLSQLISATLKRYTELAKTQKRSGAEIAALATNFKQTADALGGRVQAALAFDKFKMFLNHDEKRELQELKEEQEEEME